MKKVTLAALTSIFALVFAVPSQAQDTCITTVNNARWVEKMPGSNGPGDQGNMISANGKEFQFLHGRLDNIVAADGNGVCDASWDWETVYTDAIVIISLKNECIDKPGFKATNVTAYNCTNSPSSNPDDALEFQLTFGAEEDRMPGRAAYVTAYYSGNPDVQRDSEDNVVYQKDVFQGGDINLVIGEALKLNTDFPPSINKKQVIINSPLGERFLSKDGKLSLLDVPEHPFLIFAVLDDIPIALSLFTKDSPPNSIGCFETAVTLVVFNTFLNTIPVQLLGEALDVIRSDQAVSELAQQICEDLSEDKEALVNPSITLTDKITATAQSVNQALNQIINP